MSKSIETETVVDPALWKAKLSMAQIGCNPAEAKAAKKRVALARFFGLADGIKTVVHKPPNGEEQIFIAITGQFEALNLQTGEIFKSGTLYMPSGFQDVLISQVNQLLEAPKDSRFERREVGFALEVSSEPSNNISGYSYVARSLLPPETHDPLASLRLTAEKRLTIEDKR